MLEDKLLVLKCRRGSKDAFCRIYEKYRDDLLRLAVSLLKQADTAEDIVHDVFASFIRTGKQFRLTGSLKGYLATCVANRARNANRARRLHTVKLSEAGQTAGHRNRPDRWIICSEEAERLSSALAELPYDQRETVILHVQAGMRFRELARLQQVPIKTAQSRYRIGIEKLRSLLNSEVS
jgi:RNA polymerase sigma-70 factor (ECF subfamily)